MDFAFTFLRKEEEKCHQTWHTIKGNRSYITSLIKWSPEIILMDVSNATHTVAKHLELFSHKQVTRSWKFATIVTYIATVFFFFLQVLVFFKLSQPFSLYLSQIKPLLLLGWVRPHCLMVRLKRSSIINTVKTASSTIFPTKVARNHTRLTWDYLSLLTKLHPSLGLVKKNLALSN